MAMLMLGFLLFLLIGITIVPLFLWFKLEPNRKASIVILIFNIGYVLDIRFNFLPSLENENGSVLVGLMFIIPVLLPLIDIVLLLTYKFFRKLMFKFRARN